MRQKCYNVKSHDSSPTKREDTGLFVTITAETVH